MLLEALKEEMFQLEVERRQGKTHARRIRKSQSGPGSDAGSGIETAGVEDGHRRRRFPLRRLRDGTEARCI